MGNWTSWFWDTKDNLQNILFLILFFFGMRGGLWGGGGGLWGVKKVRYIPFKKKKKKHLIQNLFEMVVIVAYILRWLWNCGSAIVDHQTSFYLWMWTCWMVIWISKIWIYLIFFLLPQKVVEIRGRTKTKQAREHYNQYG